MLESLNCLLSPMSEGDAELYYRLRTDPEVRLYLGGPVNEASLATGFKSALEGEARIYTISEKSTLRKMGLITFDTYYDGSSLEVSYEFLPEFWGNGYAFETVKMALNHEYDIWGQKMIVAETQSRNLTSRKLLERLGFKMSSELTRFGERQTVYQYSVL
ncbi:GNAT family N-acetyltransferase [Fusibacter bizertensis]